MTDKHCQFCGEQLPREAMMDELDLMHAMLHRYPLSADDVWRQNELQELIHDGLRACGMVRSGFSPRQQRLSGAGHRLRDALDDQFGKPGGE